MEHVQCIGIIIVNELSAVVGVHVQLSYRVGGVDGVARLPCTIGG